LVEDIPSKFTVYQVKDKALFLCAVH